MITVITFRQLSFQLTTLSDDDEDEGEAWATRKRNWAVGGYERFYSRL